MYYESKYRVVKTNRFGRMMDQEPVTDLIVDAILDDRTDVYISSEWRIISVQYYCGYSKYRVVKKN